MILTSMISGTIPTGKLSQNKSLSIRYTSAMEKLQKDIINPAMVAILKPIFVYDVKLNIAAS